MRVHLSFYLFSFVVLVALIFSCVKEDVSKDSSVVEALRGKSPLLQLDIAWLVGRSDRKNGMINRLAPYSSLKNNHPIIKIH